MTAILVMLHCPPNSGYAVARLERVFLEVAQRLVGSIGKVHFAYPELTAARPDSLPADFDRVIRFDPASSDPQHLNEVEAYLRRHDIRVAFGFDQPVNRPGYAALRRGGVGTFISYWGAPMSSLNSGLRLVLKQLDVRFASGAPDHYIFESRAMQATAVRGRGIPMSKTSVTYLGVDPSLFTPAAAPSWYAHDAFGIPRDRRIVYYSGHMEERKGVHVLVRTAVELVDTRGIRNVHFLLLGNRGDEAAVFDPIYRGREAEQHVTFGGYRNDVQHIIPGAYIGAIGSTGWDSFTMSSLEIAACGVPLVVSRLPGLDETVEEGRTGYTFPVGDHVAAADRLAELLANPVRRDEMSRASRDRVANGFTVEQQIASLVETVRRVDAARPHPALGRA